MSAGNRIAVIAVGLVAVVLAFVALRPADDEQTTSATTATTVEERTTASATTVAAQPTATVDEPTTYTVSVRGGRPVQGVQVLDVTSGEKVRIRVTADAPEEVHLHGYDIEKPVGPGTPAVFEITADLEGIFEIELHGSAVPIASLRVSPS